MPRGRPARALAPVRIPPRGAPLARDRPGGGAAEGGWRSPGTATPSQLAQVPKLLSAEPDPARRAALEHAWAEAGRRRGAAAGARWRGIAAAAGASATARSRRWRPSYAANPSRLSPRSPRRARRHRSDLPRAPPTLARAEMGAGRPACVAATCPGCSASARTPELSRPAARRRRGRDDGRGRSGPRAAAGRGAGPRGATGKDPRALALPVEVPGAYACRSPPRGAPTSCGRCSTRWACHVLRARGDPRPRVSPPGRRHRESWAGLLEDLAGDPNWLSEQRARRHPPHPRRPRRGRAPAARRAHARGPHPGRIARGGEPEGERVPRRRPSWSPPSPDPSNPTRLQLFLQERDPLLESADALRALLLAAQAQAFLSSRADPPGGARRRAGSGSRRPSPRALGSTRASWLELRRSRRRRLGARGLEPRPRLGGRYPPGFARRPILAAPPPA